MTVLWWAWALSAVVIVALGLWAGRAATGRVPGATRARCFSTKLLAGRYGGRPALGAMPTAPRFRTVRQRT